MKRPSEIAFRLSAFFARSTGLVRRGPSSTEVASPIRSVTAAAAESAINGS